MLKFFDHGSWLLILLVLGTTVALFAHSLNRKRRAHKATIRSIFDTNSW